MKGTALIISKIKGIRKICSQMFPFQKKKKKNKNKSQLQLNPIKWGKSIRILLAIRMLTLTEYKIII